MYFQIVLLLTLIAVGLTAPADTPIRIDLPVYEEAASTVEPLNVKVVSSVRIDHLENDLSNTVSSVDIGGGLFAQPVTTLEGAILETEGPGSRKLTVKETLQKYAVGIFQPKPIVDTIREEEKYGNDGDKFYSAGKAIVGGASHISNVVNSALEIPSNILKQLARSATEKLNNLGGRLIGLYNK